MLKFLILGISVGYPWNALISSTDYYHEQVSTVSLAVLEAILTLTYVCSNLICFAFLNRRGRVLGISPWLPDFLSQDGGLFSIVIYCGAFLGITSALFQHAIFALAAREGPNQTRAFVFGFALAGTLASACSLTTRTFADPVLTAALNFGLTELALIIGLVVFNCRKFVTIVIVNGEERSETPVSNPIIYKGKLYRSMTVIALTMSGTLFVFPGLVASYQPVSDGQDPKEFLAVLFLLFNVGDLTGRGLSSLLNSVSDQFLVILSLIRTGLLSLCFLVNRNQILSDDESTMGDSFAYGIILMHGVFGGALFAAAAARAPFAIPDDAGKAGKLVAAITAISLAVGAFFGAVVVSNLH